MRVTVRRLAMLVLAAAVACSGCSQEYWAALIEMGQAEGAFQKGAALAAKKGIRPEERLKHYREACAHFKKALERDQSIFTLNRILSAAEACARVEDHVGEQIFSDFSDRYVREHPNEAEYGDAGVEVMEF